VAATPESRIGGTATILNVDDTISARYTKSRMLRQAGFSVIEAGSGGEALRLVREQMPQLVLLDVNLPDMSGIEVARRIKSDAATRSIPIVQISATYVTEHDQIAGLEGGAEIYLTEPLQPQELATVVRVLLRLHSTERGLLQSEARWRSFVESNIVGVVILENEALIEANEAFLRMLGYEHDDIRGRRITWRDITPPESLAFSEKALHELRTTGTVAPFEKEYVRKDGQRVWVMLGAAALGDGENRWMCFVLDISERKRAASDRETAFERERSARTHAEEATRLKDEFLANLSHELRTPMNAIIGWTHLLKSGRLEEAQRTRALESIDRAARSQAQLIEDLLDVSRIVSGKLHMSMQLVDLQSVAESAMESQRLAAQTKGVRLEVHPAKEPVTVMGDAARLHQVVLNLVSNAVKFTQAGGTVDVWVESAGGAAQVRVVDSGEGIAPEFLPFVFDRFRQADGTSTRKHSGLGLGLAIVRHVVELHGGAVSASSEGVGRGATFAVRFPLASGNGEAQKAPLADKMPGVAPDRLAGAGIRLLIVEDDPETREILAAILERGGFSYRLASGAQDGLSVLDEWQPDVIISDIGMPDVDGYEFVRKLRSRPAEKGGKIPALALSAFARDEDRKLALASGYQAHIAKPVEPADLIAAITRLTGTPGPS
jgi:PAS domain S-box-containing protein